MKKHPNLRKIVANLKHDFSFEWKHENIVFVYLNDELPDAQLIVDSSYPNDVLISVNVTSGYPHEIAALVLGCMYVVPTRLAECFYIDNNDQFHFGEKAYAAMEFENTDVGSNIFH